MDRSFLRGREGGLVALGGHPKKLGIWRDHPKKMGGLNGEGASPQKSGGKGGASCQIF